MYFNEIFMPTQCRISDIGYLWTTQCTFILLEKEKLREGYQVYF